jgi:hypothetical protein
MDEIIKWPNGIVYEDLWEIKLYNRRGELYIASVYLYEDKFGDDLDANRSKYFGILIKTNNLFLVKKSKMMEISIKVNTKMLKKNAKVNYSRLKEIYI